MTIKFTSKIIILACSVDMELDPLHIFLLLAGTIVSFLVDGIGGTLQEESVFLLGTVCFQQVLSCLGV